LLWRQLHIDTRLYTTKRKRFDALLKSSPNGILDNVKTLSISTGMIPSKSSQKQQATSALLKLLSALPQDNLDSLHSETLPIHPDVVCVLLRTQTQLRKLEIVVDEESTDGLPGGVHARNNLSQIEKIRVDVIGLCHHTYRGVCAWLALAPKLRDMSIMGRDTGNNDFEGWNPLAQPPLVKLRRLAMRHIRLPDIPQRILQHLHIPSLRELNIKECDNVEPFLLSLAQEYKQTDRSALEKFIHATKIITEDTQKASAELINSCKSLSDLQLFCFAENTVYYGAEDLEQLRLICPELKDLTVGLGDMSSFFNDVGLSEPLHFFDGHTEYTKRLVSALQSLAT
jgi:hypothetical protein